MNYIYIMYTYTYMMYIFYIPILRWISHSISCDDSVANHQDLVHHQETHGSLSPHKILAENPKKRSQFFHRNMICGRNPAPVGTVDGLYLL